MALYGVDFRTGIQRNGQISFTGWTPTLGSGTTPPQYGSGTTTGSVQFNGQTQNDDRLSKQFRKLGPALKALRYGLFNQIGNAVGTNLGQTQYRQVKGTNGDTPRSNNLVEVITVLGRNSTAADIAALRGLFTRITAPGSFTSGNTVQTIPRM